MNPLLLSLAAALLVASAPASYAHGDDSHVREAKPNLDPVQTEFGRSGDPSKVARTIRVDMSDHMRFTPELIEVKRGETIRLVASNSGSTLHEIVFGRLDDLTKHAELMKKSPGMEHDEPYMAHVAPGKHGEIVWTFDKPGEFHFGCLIPGHFEAGMQGRIRIK